MMMTDDMPTGAASAKRPWVTPRVILGDLASDTENMSAVDTDGSGGGSATAS